MKGGAVTGTIPVGDAPQALATGTALSNVYVANAGGGSVSVIGRKPTSPTTYGVTATVTGMLMPVGLTTLSAPTATSTYVSDMMAGDVRVIRTVSGSDGATTSALQSQAIRFANALPEKAIASNPKTNTAYVALSSGAIGIIVDGKAEGTIPVGFVPDCLTADPTTNTLYAASWNAHDGAAVTTIHNNAVAGKITLRPGSLDNIKSLVDDPADGVLFAALDNKTVSVLNTNTNTQIRTLPYAADALSLIPGASSPMLGLVNSADNTLTSLPVPSKNNPPKVSTVTPGVGHLNGGDTVTIVGTGFLYADQVTLADLTTDFHVDSDQAITFHTPQLHPTTAGTYQIEIHTPGGLTSAAFTYRNAPTLDPQTQSPQHGVGITATNATQTITLHGTALDGVTSATFDGVPVSNLHVQDATTLSFTKPPTQNTTHSADIVVNSPYGSGEIKDAYTLMHAETGNPLSTNEALVTAFKKDDATPTVHPFDSVDCPIDYPYLKRFRQDENGAWNYYANLSPGRINPGGVQVIEPGGVAVSTYVDPNRSVTIHDSNGEGSGYTGIKGDYDSWNGTQNLSINLLCTKSFWQGAWDNGASHVDGPGNALG